MSQDYRRFKTPFYEVSVGDASGKRMVKLPHHILRLVEKIEVLETLEKDSFSIITIVFIEGSREPASQDPSQGTEGLYKLDKDIAGSLTNRTGIITDLRFSGDHGITFLTEAEQTTGKIQTDVVNISGQRVSRQKPTESSNPQFLFQENNQVKVSWGYKEDPSTVRAVRGHIKVIQTEFPESGQPTTTITCQDPSASWDQLAAVNGVNFFTTQQIRKNSEFLDVDTAKLVKILCDKMGIDCITSQAFPASTLDKGKVKAIMGGESFKQFMDRLAQENNAYWRVIIHPATGKETLFFIEKTSFEKRTIIPPSDQFLLTFKNPGSIIKRVSIKADFGAITDNTQVGVNSEATDVQQEAVTSQLFDTTYPNEKPASNDPSNIPSTDGIKNNILGSDNVTGKVEINPKVDDPGLVSSVSGIKSSDSRKRIISLELDTIGYTRLFPGVVRVDGIGVRYSGAYRAMTVRHTLDSAGYNTNIMAISQSLSAGGTLPPPPESPKAEDPKESSQLFESEEQDKYLQINYSK